MKSEARSDINKKEKKRLSKQKRNKNEEEKNFFSEIMEFIFKIFE